MSRYPTFGANQLYPYDRNLLARAPSVTREDRQAGYDIDIVERGVTPRVQHAAPNPFNDTPTNLLNKELPSHPAVVDAPSPVRTYTYHWYKTKRGIAIIILGFLILLSVIVGVAVGVTNEKRRQAALAAAQSTGAGPSNTTASTSSASSTSHTSNGRPSHTSGPVMSTPKIQTPPSSPTVPMIASPTGTPQVPPPSAVPPPTSGAVNPSQGLNEGNAGAERPRLCRVLPLFC